MRMGTSTNFYTIYGVKTEWDDEFSQAYDEVDERTPLILMDNICCEYMIFGTPLFDSGDARWCFEGGDVYTEIDISSLGDCEEKYKKAFITKFPKFAYLIEKPFRLVSLVHYS
jgi:hypothetical protein